MARAMASLRSTSRSPTRCNTSPRTGAGVLDQSANPRWADATARATSSGPERGKQPMASSRSAGLRFSKYAPVAGATHWPPMKFLKFSVMGGVRGRGSGVRGQGSAWLRNVRAQPYGLGRGADAGQHFPREQQDTPDDQHL